MAHIFISYSRVDESFARQLATSLSDLGADVWIDIEDIPAGMKWSSAIQQGLRQCEIMIIIVSPDSMASKNAEDEWQDYLDTKKPLIPVLYRTVPPADIHFQLRRIQWIDFNRQDYNSAFRQLWSELARNGVQLNPIVGGEVEKPLPFPSPGFIASATIPKPTRQPIRFIVGGATVVLVALVIVIAILSSGQQPATPATTIAIIPSATSQTPTNEPTPTFSAPTTVLTPPALPGYLGGEPITASIHWTEVTNPDDPGMVLVPVGSFMMGSEDDGQDDELPVVEQPMIHPFWIDRTEVTRAMYTNCVKAAKCLETSVSNSSTRDNQPINRVTWFQAHDYCVWRGGRLPTEVEWEYAARGPDNRIYPWIGGFDPANVVYQGNSNNQTADVGSRPGGASWVGALDMSGNVREWVNTIYDILDLNGNPTKTFIYPYQKDDREDTKNTTAPRVIRGGSFENDSQNPRLRATYRNWTLKPSDISDYFGFRCAADYKE